MTSRERTAHWVQSHNPNEFYSPSAPPSVIDGFVTSPPSEAESSLSVPPRMVLRYPDGRPDVPIQPLEPIHPRSRRPEDSSSRSPVSPHSSNNRQRSGSHSSSPLAQSYHTASRSSERSPPSPEEIRVLPSHANERPHPSSSSHHGRSKSLPRTADLRSHGDAFAPPPVPPVAPQAPFHPPSLAPQPPAWHSYRGRPHKQPPAIVYAPSHHSRTHYTPPTMYHYPPQMGPNGMIYSHSAPVKQTQIPHNMASAPSGYQHNMVHPSHIRGGPLAGRSRGDLANQDRSRSLSARRRATNPSSSSSSLSSDESGGTYYILPHQGQKVHIIVRTIYPKVCIILTSFNRPPAPSVLSRPRRRQPGPLLRRTLKHSRNHSYNAFSVSPGFRL
jgi:hypothetical protein